MDFSKYRDEMLEAWDWETGMPTGEAVSREASYKKGIPHEGVHLWIVRNISGFNELLFQKRAMDKTLFPGVLDITVGGHVPYGMDKGKVQKEAWEELGISPEDSDMVDIGYIRFEEKTDHYWHREFQHVFIMENSLELNEYNFRDGEVDGIYAVPLEQFSELMIENCSLRSSFYAKGECGIAILEKKDFHPLLFSEKMEKYMRVVISAVNERLTEGIIYTKMPFLSPPVL